MKNKPLIPLIVIFLFVTGTAFATTFTVINTNDGGPGSFRQAIFGANVAADVDTIDFDIPPGDPNCAVILGHGTVCTISLSTQADIIFPVVIDGFTQPGATPNTNPITMGSNAVLLIEIRSPHTPGSQNSGLILGSNSSGSTVRGLVMNRLSTAIDLNGSNNNTIEGNFLGTDPTGTAARPNIQGVRMIFSANNNTVGGTSPAARNLISGNSGIGIQIEVNSSGTVVQGNFVGTNAAGNAALGNAPSASGIITVGNNSQNTLIGGDTVDARNVIVPDAQGAGIDISNTHSGVQVRGNFIGTDLTGTVRLENSSRGVRMFATTGVAVGGPTETPGMPPGNLIASGDFGVGGQSVTQLTVQGNLIGTDIRGAVLPYSTPPVVGTTYGLSLHNATGGLIGGAGSGEGNVIAGHTDSGVRSMFGDPIAVAILGNSIHSNGGIGNGLGIDLAFAGISANDVCDTSHPQNFPEITSASFGVGSATLSGTLNSAPNSAFRLEFFSNPTPDSSDHGEGRTFIGSANVTTDGSCNGSFGPLVLSRPGGHYTVTSTATRLDAVGTPTQTSEFSENVTLFPTATTVSISGRVISQKGGGLAQATLTLTDSEGNVRRAVTNTFGYYKFDDVEAGATYILAVDLTKYRFNDSPRVIMADDELTNVDFVASATKSRSRL